MAVANAKSTDRYLQLQQNRQKYQYIQPSNLKMTAQENRSRRLQIALIVLGRLGAIRTRILAFQQPCIELVAACDAKPGANKWAIGKSAIVSSILC